MILLRLQGQQFTRRRLHSVPQLQWLKEQSKAPFLAAVATAG